MIKPIVKLITDLNKSSVPVTKEDNYKEIIQDLKDTLTAHPNGIGLSAPQIGVQKQISYAKIPKSVNAKLKKIEYFELVMINPKIIETEGKILLKREGCLSFPGIHIDTDRYIYITISYLDENFDEKMASFKDLESFVVQHELDHLKGLTIMNRKHKAR